MEASNNHVHLKYPDSLSYKLIGLDNLPGGGAPEQNFPENVARRSG